jgi:hypothetical protein
VTKPSSRYFDTTTGASNQDATLAFRTHNLKPAEKLCRKSRFGIALLPAHDSAAESESDSVPHIERKTKAGRNTRSTRTGKNAANRYGVK